MLNPLRTRARVRLPAEWERQAGVMLTWPHAGGDWGDSLEAAHADFVALAANIARFQPLVIACADQALAEHIETDLKGVGIERGQFALVICPSNDVWARDHGPLTVYKEEQGRPLLLDFGFNGWGGKYAHDLDDQVTRRLHAAGVFGSVGYRRIDWILEGGSIDTDGQGTVLTTASCVLTATRNPGITRAQVELQFQQQLGAERTLWLEHGELEGDDTDGHVDMLARFADARTIVYQACDDTGDAHHAPLARMRAELESLRTPEGEPYRLLPLPWPRARHAPDGHRLPLSYANFLIINDAVLVPQYQDAADTAALDVLREAFPDREVIGTPALALIGQHGSVHCVTMQIPWGVALPALGQTVVAA